MQKMIVSYDRIQFDHRVNEVLSAGGIVVPGTLSMAMTSHRKSGNEGGNFLQSRYAVVVEQAIDTRPPEEAEEEAIVPEPECRLDPFTGF